MTSTSQTPASELPHQTDRCGPWAPSGQLSCTRFDSSASRSAEPRSPFLGTSVQCEGKKRGPSLGSHREMELPPSQSQTWSPPSPHTHTLDTPLVHSGHLLSPPSQRPGSHQMCLAPLCVLPLCLQKLLPIPTLTSSLGLLPDPFRTSPASTRDTGYIPGEGRVSSAWKKRGC